VLRHETRGPLAHVCQRALRDSRGALGGIPRLLKTIEADG
jgi:hypothetical protein